MPPTPSDGDDNRDVVLYVEDHPVNVLLMQTVFELRPELRLVVAVDGATAMAAACDLRPSLLLLDLRLPDCHGTQLLERMRELPGWAEIPAIAVTAEAEFIREGTTFSDVWHKPLRVPTLLTRLDRVLAPKGTPKSGDGPPARGGPSPKAALSPSHSDGGDMARSGLEAGGTGPFGVLSAMRLAY